MLYFLMFWKVSGGKVWFIKGFERFECQSVPELPNHYFSLSNRCSGKHFGAQGRQSSWSITFHYENDALWYILKLKVPRRQPELPNHYFSLSKRCPVRHFRAEGAQKAARAPKALLFIIEGRASMSLPPQSLKFLWLRKDICEKVGRGEGGDHISLR